jgi:polar amino acid transport system permease protein
VNKKTKNIISFGLALLTYGAILALFIYFYPGKNNFDLSRLSNKTGLIIDGFILTIIISIISLFLSVIIGFLLYLAVNSKNNYIKSLGTIYNEVIFGIPLVVFLTFMYFFIFAVFRSGLTAILGQNESVFVGIIAISIYMGPYMKNVFEGAIKSIDENQYQAMTVFGFTPYQKYRYIILPQLVKVIIPPLIGNFSYVIKSSTLLHVMLVNELYAEIKRASLSNLAIMEGYVLMFFLYLIITIPLIRLAKGFERRFGV